jgi:hypothetical protein
MTVLKRLRSRLDVVSRYWAVGVACVALALLIGLGTGVRAAAPTVLHFVQTDIFDQPSPTPVVLTSPKGEASGAAATPFAETSASPTLPSPSPTPTAPIVQGAPCYGQIVNGGCVGSGVISPPPPAPCTDQPGAPCAHGAPCYPPGIVVNGNCVPSGLPAPSPTPNPTPGHGAPCLPPGVLDANGNCNVPTTAPSPSQAPASPPPSPPPSPGPSPS